MPSLWDYIHIRNFNNENHTNNANHHNLQDGLFQIATQTCSILVQVNNTNNISYGDNSTNIQYNNYNTDDINNQHHHNQQHNTNENDHNNESSLLSPSSSTIIDNEQRMVLIPPSSSSSSAVLKTQSSSSTILARTSTTKATFYKPRNHFYDRKNLFTNYKHRLSVRYITYASIICT